MKKAVFLDRDGTINIDEQGYISKPEDFVLFHYTAEAISLLNKLDYNIFVISNQSGIARGYYSFEDLEKIHQKMLLELERSGAQITDIFISPYHEDGKVEPYNVEHEDRKPGLGLFKHSFSIKNSFMIGDKYSDIAFGRKAGLITILVRSGEGNEEFMQHRNSRQYKPHYVAKDLLSAAKLIERMENQ